MGLFSSKKLILLNQYFIIESEVVEPNSLKENIKDSSKWIYKRKKLKHILYQRMIEGLEIEPQVGDTICGKGIDHSTFTYKFGRVKERFIFSHQRSENDHLLDIFSYKGDFGKITTDFDMVLELEPTIVTVHSKSFDEIKTKDMVPIMEKSDDLGRLGFRIRREKDHQFWNDWYTKFEEEGLV